MADNCLLEVLVFWCLEHHILQVFLLEIAATEDSCMFLISLTSLLLGLLRPSLLEYCFFLLWLYVLQDFSPSPSVLCKHEKSVTPKIYTLTPPLKSTLI